LSVARRRLRLAMIASTPRRKMYPPSEVPSLVKRGTNRDIEKIERIEPANRCEIA